MRIALHPDGEEEVFKIQWKMTKVIHLATQGYPQMEWLDRDLSTLYMPFNENPVHREKHPLKIISCPRRISSKIIPETQTHTQPQLQLAIYPQRNLPLHRRGHKVRLQTTEPECWKTPR